jgi:membrane associated rhomboid family serine protease
MSEQNGGAPPGPLAELGFYSSEKEASAHGLVVLALGHCYWLTPGEGGVHLQVEPQILEEARWHLERYQRESLRWPPPAISEEPIPFNAEPLTPMVWALVVAWVFIFQDYRPGMLEALGAVDSEAILGRGQWWRLFTALFLHADLAHLVGNLVGGLFVFSTLIGVWGRLKVWWLLALGSVVGNALALLVHFGMPYRSLGASTAIFAGLGLLTGRALARERRQPQRWRRLLVPLASGLGLLALFGTGGLRSDLSAHLGGFLAGLVLGLWRRLLR